MTEKPNFMIQYGTKEHIDQYIPKMTRHESSLDNPYATDEQIEKFHDMNAHILKTANQAKYASSPEELRRHVASQFWTVRYAAARNPNLSPEQMDHFTKHIGDDHVIDYSFAQNQSLFPRHIDKLLDSDNGSVRSACTRAPKFSRENFEKALKHPSRHTRQAAVNQKGAKFGYTEPLAPGD